MKLTPYYKNDLVTLYKGDCLEILPQLTETFDACITDPPYGTTAYKWDSVTPFDPMWKEMRRLIKPLGAICIFGAEPFSSALRMSNLPMFKYDWIYVKGNSAGFVNAKLKPMNRHEIISVFSQGKTANCNKNNMVYYPQGLIPYGKPDRSGNKPTKENTYYRPAMQSGHTCNAKHADPDGDTAIHCPVGEYIREFTNYPHTVLSFNRKGESRIIHPTQKPVALLEYLVKTYTLQGELVLDFTCGSGTTGVACMNTGRHCVLIEREEKYCEITAKRCEEARGLFTE